ncbi:hypothetical protein D9611_000095 [Ephemerocybe angulata]|uniref:N-alpha-acetyltransferase 60 n=1 Tax=Ephemerocybe angulata TaxID=980116 RepID=A0A8H5BMD6_9AGAR|nr:hypothetical protein D9611_000095 [Tulosesus angulatus]
MEIRPLRSHDLVHVRELHRKLLPVAYPPAFFLQLLIVPDRLCLVAADAGVPVAFVSAALHGIDAIAPRSPRIELLTLGVAPAYQHSGLASLLVRRIHDALRLKTRPDAAVVTSAHVATTNARAIAFYQHLGLYVIPEVLQGFYRTASGPKDAFLVMGVL